MLSVKCRPIRKHSETTPHLLLFVLVTIERNKLLWWKEGTGGPTGRFCANTMPIAPHTPEQHLDIKCSCGLMLGINDPQTYLLKTIIFFYSILWVDWTQLKWFIFGVSNSITVREWLGLGYLKAPSLTWLLQTQVEQLNTPSSGSSCG